MCKRDRSHIGDSLPIAVTREIIYRYYDIVDLTVYFSNNKLRYVIRIPLRHIARRYHSVSYTHLDVYKRQV